MIVTHMDQTLLRTLAMELERLLLYYAAFDKDAALLKYAVDPILQSALRRQVTAPVDWDDVPGGLLFSESGLSKFADLEDAYSRFKIEITGGESLGMKMFKARQGVRPDRN